MDFAALESFLEVARRGGITAAAEELHLSQPAVTGQIQRLEAALGVRLLYRSGKGVQLTREGMALLPLIEEVVRARDRALEYAEELAGLKRGRVVLSSGSVQAATFLPGAVADFAQRYPGIELSLRIMPSHRSVEALKRGDVHLAILSTSPQDDAIATELLYREEVLLIAPPGDPGARGGLTDAADVAHAAASADLAALFARHRLLTYSQGSGYRAYIDAYLAAVGCRPGAILEVDDITVIVSMVERGVGAAFVPRSSVRGKAAQGTVTVVRPATPPPPRSIYLARHRKRPLSGAEGALEAVVRRQAGILAGEKGPA